MRKPNKSDPVQMAKSCENNPLFSVGKDGFTMGRERGSIEHDEYIYDKMVALKAPPAATKVAFRVYPPCLEPIYRSHASLKGRKCWRCKSLSIAHCSRLLFEE
jgi:hypothetical protein